MSCELFAVMKVKLFISTLRSFSKIIYKVYRFAKLTCILASFLLPHQMRVVEGHMLQRSPGTDLDRSVHEEKEEEKDTEKSSLRGN